ncbi:MAG: prepilin-type N-terminal cleavage/methylation domain-containing protein, partial [Pseudomonadota bacterium]
MKRQHGFTLMEVIIALGVSGLFLTLLVSSLRSNSARLQEANRIYDLALLRGQISSLIREKLEAAVIHTTDDTQDQAFIGNTNQFRFIAPAPLSMRGVGLARYDLVAQQNASGQLDIVFQVRRTPMSLDPDIREVLISNVKNFQVSYGTPSNQGLRYRSDWTLREAIPTAIKISIQTGGNNSETLTFNAQTKV